LFPKWVRESCRIQKQPEWDYHLTKAEFNAEEKDRPFENREGPGTRKFNGEDRAQRVAHPPLVRHPEDSFGKVLSGELEKRGEPIP
jgi:hypothetical protein